MTRLNFNQIYAFIRPYLQRFIQLAQSGWAETKGFVFSHITSWWQLALIAVSAIVFLYYPFGGWLIHSIDTSSYHPRTEDGRLASVDTISYLVNREVHYKLWTPNLPFLFPSYFLDDMPNFQLGLMSAIGKTTKALDSLPLKTASDTARINLNEATEFLQYPGNIWLVSPQNHLLPAPSSASQYKKGRKKLNNFNREVIAGKVVLERSPQNLSLILHIIRKDINRNIIKTENHIRETQDAFLDFKADNTFYFAQGKLYAYSLLLKAFGHDFKNVLVKYDIYQQWTNMLKSLEQASDLNPTIVRNGKLNSSIAPNHLVTLNYFASRTVNSLYNLINKLDKPMELPQ